MKTPYIFVAAILFVLGMAVYVKDVMALERTVDVDGVNYVSLEQMGKKYNLSVEEENGVIKIVGESVNLSVPIAHNLFTLNGVEHTAQTPPKFMEGSYWITAKDWANMFDLSLTHYSGISHMAPTKSDPVTTDADMDFNSYEVSPEWGESVPKSVRKHGDIQKIYNPHFEEKIYDSEHYNGLLESKESIQYPGM